jgi:ABC-type sulfate transport system permease component
VDTLKDIWASLVAGVRDRTTNPLSVAFVLSWCLWNYKFFIIVFGDDSTALRLKSLEEMYPHVQETYMGAALLYPVLSAFAYVFLYPVVGMVAVWVYRKYQVTTANLVKNAERARRARCLCQGSRKGNS